MNLDDGSQGGGRLGHHGIYPNLLIFRQNLGIIGGQPVTKLGMDSLDTLKSIFPVELEARLLYILVSSWSTVAPSLPATYQGGQFSQQTEVERDLLAWHVCEVCLYVVDLSLPKPFDHRD